MIFVLNVLQVQKAISYHQKLQLYRMIVNMRKNVLRYRKDTLQSPDGAKRTLDGHQTILLALQLKNPELCERMMRDHIKQAKEDALYQDLDKVKAS